MSFPYSTGRNWTRTPDEGWRWSDETITLIVSEHTAPFGKFYRLTVRMDDGVSVVAFGQRSTPDHWFKRAADIYKAWSTAHVDFSCMPEHWARGSAV